MRRMGKRLGCGLRLHPRLQAGKVSPYRLGAGDEASLIRGGQSCPRAPLLCSVRTRSLLALPANRACPKLSASSPREFLGQRDLQAGLAMTVHLAPLASLA